jgi:hypothetical protein
MAEKSYFKQCKSCGIDMAKDAKACPNCGKSLKSGLFFKLIIGIGLLAAAGTIAIPKPKDQLKVDIKKISRATADQVDAQKLARILKHQSTNLSLQEENLEKHLIGKIVDWELQVLVVATFPDHYDILTMPTSGYPGTLLTLYPQNSHQRTFIDNVKAGTKIKIKGKIAGIFQRRIQINPALLN